jgi:hypothetical protein
LPHLKFWGARFKKYHVFLIATTIFSSASADGVAIEYKKSRQHDFVVAGDGATRKLSLPVSIVDWRIDCSQSRAVIWGQPHKPTPLGVKPYAVAYVVDIRRLKVLQRYSMTRGPHNAEFSADRTRILIDDLLIEFNSGRLVQNFSSKDFLFDREVCEDFQGRQLSE